MIKAIETHYNGHRFRSRLEARWAVFFDSLGISWEYEKEGFNVDGTWYLPDFYLPHLDLWIEIKPGDPEHWPSHVVFDSDEWDKNFIVLIGKPWVDPTMGQRDWIGQEDFGYSGVIAGDTYYRWCECPDCGFIGIEFDGRSDRLACKVCFGCWCISQEFTYSPYSIQSKNWGNDICRYHVDALDQGCPRHAGNGDKGYNVATPRLLKAYENAMKSRFEFGEKGGMK